jgi:FAD/FMN-containing dehydrogenase/Fe-S oxidoreductase
VGTPGAATDSGLAQDLRRVIGGEVRFDPGARGAYAHDASLYRQVPIGVVVPHDADDVAAAVEVCSAHEVPILPRGCGTSLAGQCVNTAVVIDFSKYMHAILELDPEARTARVQPGVICDQLRDEAERYHLTFGPDPATHDHCTVGGMIGNNSCGTHSLMAGKTADNVIAMDVLTYDGARLRVARTDEHISQRALEGGGRVAEIQSGLERIRDRYEREIRERYPKIPRRISGYNLDALLPEQGFDVAKALIGTEGTCVLVLAATCRLVPSPRKRTLAVLGYPDPVRAAWDVPRLLEHRPIALEGFNEEVVNRLERKGFHKQGESLLPEGRMWLLVEFGGDTQEEADAAAQRMLAGLRGGSGGPSRKLYDRQDEESAVWEIRRNGVGSGRVPGEHGGWPNWEDAAVAPEVLGDYLEEYLKLCDRYRYNVTVFGHFGQGCVHNRHDFRLRTADGVRRFREFMEEASDLVIRFGGSLSGEHGDGHGRAEFLPKMFGPDVMRAFWDFKQVWDPRNRMNPGKVVNAHRIDEHLWEHPGLRPFPVRTHFRFPDDGGSFFDAANRCFGIGKCRHVEGGTMCPSFMATREEVHSTRGRARLLAEMLQTAGPVRNPWRSRPVKEALHLCLACKGCKTDCPVRVDMATYKAEFLSHYYRRRLRPRTAYAFGPIMYWARAASLTPWLPNALLHAPGLAAVLKRAAGVAPEREIPRFAAKTFRRRFRQRASASGAGLRTREVILWPDTFTNHFEPHIGMAAVDVLESAGFAVRIPDRVLCCGRPLYDFGMLHLARRLLGRVVDSLRPDIQAGTPVVGVEPSCVAVFRDELPNLFPNDADAQRLAAQSFTLAEFLQRDESGYEPPHSAGRALVHGHCHEKAVLRFDAETALLQRMGIEVEVPDSGCCGMAGSFGYEQGERYRVSQACGERVLFPAVREAPESTLVIADGFSCRTQIEHGTARGASHLAEVLRNAQHGDDGAAVEPGGREEARPARRVLAGVAGGAALVGAAVAANRLGRHWYQQLL